MSGLFQYFLTFSFSNVHYHAIGKCKNGLKCKSSQWWASTQPPAKLYLSHRQVCCHVASSQYYNLCFTSLWNLWSVYHSLLVMFVFVHIGRNLNYIQKDNFWKNIVFYCIDKNLQRIKNILLCIFKFSHETENHSQLLCSAFTVA